MTRFEVRDDGGLYAAVTLPNLIVGTVGGGTQPAEPARLSRHPGPGGSRPCPRVRRSRRGARAGRRAVDHRRARRRTLHARASAPGPRRRRRRRPHEALDRLSARAVPARRPRPLVAAFSASAVSLLLARARPRRRCPSAAALLVAFVDVAAVLPAASHRRRVQGLRRRRPLRPYRPVPRGLVTLRELAWVGVGAAVVQLALALWLDAVAGLAARVTWLYLALMTREFFARALAEAHPSSTCVAHADPAAGRSLRDRVRLAGRGPACSRHPACSGSSSSAT